MNDGALYAVSRHVRVTISGLSAAAGINDAFQPFQSFKSFKTFDEVAEYFAGQKSQPITGVKADAKSLSRGATLATQCVSCHGPKGDGESERAIPGVRGQNPSYLQAQMTLFAGDKRKLDDAGLDENKKRVFKGLSESDLADLAVYYATLK
ncbi:MAG TPA: c-type cytochrome [Candidatus Binatia bacterium]|nr:c-type cytochrome [Candidatus Binatia bacterium]